MWFSLQQQSNYSMTSSLPSKTTLIYMILCYSWSWTRGFKEKQEFHSKRWNEDVGARPTVWDYPGMICAHSHMTSICSVIQSLVIYSTHLEPLTRGSYHRWLHIRSGQILFLDQNHIPHSTSHVVFSIIGVHRQQRTIAGEGVSGKSSDFDIPRCVLSTASASLTLFKRGQAFHFSKPQFANQ